MRTILPGPDPGAADPAGAAAGAARSARIRARRGPKRPPDPARPIDSFWETEREPDGARTPTLTILLAGAECPFTCVFCDLWTRTLDGPTPPGALPAQIGHALRTAGPAPGTPAARPAAPAVKLYNASNFFDPRAVPPADDPAIAAAVAGFGRVTVECHPRLVGRRCLDFAARTAGRLEVAMGLETADPAVLARLNKAMTLADFDRAAAALARAGIGLRTFVLVPAPFAPPAAAAADAARAVRYAADLGAARVALIPTRGGPGALDDLAAAGAWTPPTADLIDAAAARCADVPGVVVTVDLWAIERVITCRRCGPGRIARWRRFNATGRLGPRRRCPACTPRPRGPAAETAETA